MPGGGSGGGGGQQAARPDLEAEVYQAPEAGAAGAGRGGGGGGGAEVGEAADFWAVGVLLAQLLGGGLPFTHGQLSALRRGHEQLPRLGPAVVGEAASSLMRSLLRPRPADRLGYAGPHGVPRGRGAPAVRAHPFFAATDWGRLLAGQLSLPLQADADGYDGHGAAAGGLSHSDGSPEGGFGGSDFGSASQKQQQQQPTPQRWSSGSSQLERRGSGASATSASAYSAYSARSTASRGSSSSRRRSTAAAPDGGVRQRSCF
eukprot:SAG22_NODE_1492_length_4303_cov_15.785205_3_plen_260_part_00